MEPFTHFLKGQRIKILRFTRRRPSTGENEKSKVNRQESPSDTKNFFDSLDPFLVEAINKATYLNSVDEIVTEVVSTVLPTVIQEVKQEQDQEEILDRVISCVAENEIRALIKSILEECHAETVILQQQQQQQQVAAFAAEQLIDMFFMEHLMGKMSFQGPRFPGEEHVSLMIDSLILDILLGQFFSIQQQQQSTSENVPLRDFHLKAFTEVALDVVLTELNKVMEEDMADLLEYERNVHI